MRKLSSFLLLVLFLLLTNVVVHAQNVTVAGATIGNGSYATLGAAFTAINGGAQTGSNITITLSGNTTESATATLNTGAWATLAITATTPVTISGDVVGAIIKFNGADNVTMDGRIGGVGRNITVSNTSTATGTAAIWLASVVAGNGASNNIIRNLEISCGVDVTASTSTSFGIIMCGITISATSNGTDNDNNQFLENRIVKCRYGILTRGTTTNLNLGIVVSDNIIGPSSFGSDAIGKVGIFMQADQGAIVSRNTVQFVGGTNATTTSGADRIGIAIGNESWSNSPGTLTSNTYTVTNNIIHDIVDERLFSAVGITLGTTGGGSNTDNIVANNFVYNILSNGSGGDQAVGIGISGGKNDKVVFNTVYMTGELGASPLAATTTSASGIRIGLASSTSFLDLTVKNNLIYVDLTSSNGLKHFCISSNSGSFNWGTGGCDNNNYYYPATNSQMQTGGVGNTTSTTTPWTGYQSLTNWKTAFTPAQDASSKDANPPFISSTNLHLTAGVNTAIESGGVAIPGITTDIDNDTRPGPAGSVNGGASAPDIGADEFDGAPAIALDLAASALINPLTDVCNNASVSVTVRIKNEGTSIIDFANNNATVTATVSGATATVLNASLVSGTLNPGATQDIILSPVLNMTADGTYNFAISAVMSGDGNAGNNSINGSSTIALPLSLPQANNFTGFTGSNLPVVFPNWSEGTGASAPTGTTSGWTSQATWPSNTTAKINLFSNTKNDWITGPKFTATANSILKFDVAITNFNSTDADPDGMAGLTIGVPTDDQVIVRVSTDCGATFSDLYTFDASNTASITNTLVPQTINLSAYAGQNIIIAFFATEGAVNDVPDYDFHIDNINIYDIAATDIGALSLSAPLPPPASGCYSGAETVSVTIKNYGSSTIDFSLNPVTVTTTVTGAANQVLAGTINAGTLAPDATTDVLMTTTLNMTASGTYTFNAVTSMTGDGEPGNDAMPAANRVNAPIVALPETVDFTGYTGANLTTNFPNWYEADGASLPAGTISGWTSSTSIAGSGTTARINLAGSTDQEWIVGPKFTVSALTRLKFKVAITDASSANADPDGMAGNTSGIPTDDQVIVKISTNCGQSFSDLFVFDASNTASITNALVEQTIQLGAYAGQTVIIAFFATEGTVDDAPSYDFHIDDINISDPPALDAGALTLNAPNSAGGCYGTAETVTVTIKNFGTSTIDFTLNPVTVTTNVTGAAVATLNGTINSGTLAPDATTNVNMSATLDMSAGGTYTFNASTSMTGDGEASNDAMTPVNRVSQIVTLPQTVNFTGFTGSNLTTNFPNWREGSGATLPAGTTSAWTSSTVIAGSGTTAKILLSTASDEEWIVGPKFTAGASTRLKFKIAITDASSANADPDGMAGVTSGVPTDDQVIVKVSTDCGASYSDLYVFDASNTASITNVLEEQTIGLGAYAGQNIIVAIFATEGTVDDAPSYDFHIDDIEISTPPALDAGAIALFAPLPQPASGCLTATQPITITIKNYGTATIDFSTNPVTVTTSITGAGAGLLTGTINAGTLAPDATMNVPMTGTLDMTAAGTYTFNASTSMTGDGEPSNNGMTAVNIINAPVVSLPQTVDFTGFTGSNLTSVFANWSEGDGASLPVGTSSSWTSSTVIPGSGTTAKILLSAASDQEWIVGPKFMAGASTRLKFKVAITESSSADADPDGMAGNTSGIPTDDQVIVRISTDCGATFSDLFTFDANNTASITNSLVEQTIQLSSYAGQTVIIAFFATEGTTDDASAYDFHIDDINIETPPAIDAGAITLVSPAVQTCYTNNETVTVRVKNYGLNTLDFSITPLTVNTNVSGVAVAALSGTVNSGTLAPDATVDVPMSATLDMSATGVYTFNASTTLAGDGLPGNDALNPAVNRTAIALVVGTASASTNAVCGSGAPVLTLSGSAGGNIQWQESTVSGSGPWNNVGTNSTTYTPDGPVSGPTWYQAIVSCGLNSGTSNVVSVGYLNPQVLTTTPASRCGFGTVDLQATGSGSSTLNWYSSASGGTVLGSGSPFTTPAIGTTTTFYVAATEGTTIKSVGAPSNGATGTYTLEAGLLFDVSAPSVTINGVYIYPIGTGAGTVNIALKNSGGTTLQSLSFPCTGTTSPGIKTYVPLDWTVNSGTGYYLDMTSRTGSVASLIRDVNADIVGGAIATNPAMTIPGLITITSGRLGSSGTSTSYYFFYDWQVSAPCEGPRTAVTATVNPADPIIITPSSVVRCQFDAASNLTASSTYAYTNYTWSPGTGLNATSGASVQANPAVTTEYTVTGTDGVCTDTAKVTVTVNLAPENVLASASPNPVCEGETVTLNSSAVLPASIPRFILNGNCGTGFIDISASGTSVPGTLLDDSEHNITIPAFTFNGVSYTTARVGMNGAIVLGSTTGDVSATNAALPSTANTAGNLLIAPFWDDLDTLVTSSIKTETIGSVFIIQYTNLVHFSYAGGSITFQVQLDLNTSVITFVYQDAEFGNPTYDFAATATIGVQVSSSSAVQYSSNTASLSNGQCISFTPNLISYSWTGPNSFVSAVQNPVLSNVVTLNAGTYTVTFSAANGCNSSASVNLTVNTPSGILAGSPGGPPVSKTTMISGLTTFNESGTCKLIATVNPSGTSPVSGNVTAKVWIENSVPVHGANPFVARHYEINAASNPATSTGTVTLYFTQGEFDAFNADAGSTLNLPANSADASGIANLRVIRYPGTSSDGSGHPATYSGIPIMIDPADVNINWNAGFSRWEISFDVTGFSGFTVGTSSTLNLCPSGGFAIPAGASGTSYQWQLNTGSGFNNIADGPNYNGSGTATLILTNLPSSFSGYQYQALVDNVPSVVYTVKFVLTWQGSSSTNWHTASNWGACGVIPDQYTDVVIPSGKSLYPVLSSNGSAKSVKAAPGSTVTVSTGAVLDITGQ